MHACAPSTGMMLECRAQNVSDEREIFVELLFSFYLYMVPRDRTQVSRLVQQVSLPIDIML